MKTPSIAHSSVRSLETERPNPTPAAHPKPSQLPRSGDSFTPAASTKLPHQSNPQDTVPLRNQIEQQVKQNSSFYATLVGGVNHLLRASNVGISPASHQSVMNNLQQVHQGNMTQSAAHLREATGFAQDSANSLRHGRVAQGMVEGSGVVLNSIGAVGMSALEGMGHPDMGDLSKGPKDQW